jgi:hypothetical protein
MKAGCTLALAATALLAADVRPSAAAAIYPWCVHRFDGEVNCGFATLEQCRAGTIKPGTCIKNPWYEPRPSVRTATRRRD